MFLRAIKGQLYENKVREICSIYIGDIDKSRLEAQLPLLRPTATALEFELTKFTIYDLFKLFQGLDYSRKIAMSEVINVAKSLLVMPAASAINERSFSAMKRVKTYLRSTTTDSRMSHLIMLHVHKERVDNRSMINVANEFLERVPDSRKQIFRKFTKSDLCVKMSVARKFIQVYVTEEHCN